MRESKWPAYANDQNIATDVPDRAGNYQILGREGGSYRTVAMGWIEKLRVTSASGARIGLTPSGDHKLNYFGTGWDLLL